MALAFSLECVAILVLFAFIDRPALFVVLTGLVFFGWGEIFSLFPSTLTDTFGPKYAATNYGFLYIAQGVGSILGGPAAAFLKQTTGSWNAVFIIVACSMRSRQCWPSRCCAKCAGGICRPANACARREAVRVRPGGLKRSSPQSHFFHLKKKYGKAADSSIRTSANG